MSLDTVVAGGEEPELVVPPDWLVEWVGEQPPGERAGYMAEFGKRAAAAGLVLQAVAKLWQASVIFNHPAIESAADELQAVARSLYDYDPTSDRHES